MPLNSHPEIEIRLYVGKTFISDGAIFSISFLTSKMDSVYPGSPKNTFFSKKFWDLVPQIAPWSFGQFFDKNTTPQSSGCKTLNFHRIFKCHTILESWDQALNGAEVHLTENSMTNEKSAPENWQKNFFIFLVKPRTENFFGQKCLFLCISKEC